ncbi:hypothetical protein BO70DRAFT_127414 [Aspergillus heteromorphus CBS 117.55]|uniref:Transmembrane protein n=1 Tax=Aspergillus heteromorphus CBS 117.55 TaxID=1448321 RepID=A0A317WUJ2_9EURO|nr:uncharacterized protein BO70DRAFT_127414 [Aspergillus heteromorphus CBS 117.55]PWY89745.1 hypothetical protein BO70DRAFT_127414 [Aspergillus heteromorphus CBS 117.55]
MEGEMRIHIRFLPYLFCWVLCTFLLLVHCIVVSSVVDHLNYTTPPSIPIEYHPPFTTCKRTQEKKTLSIYIESMVLSMPRAILATATVTATNQPASHSRYRVRPYEAHPVPNPISNHPMS